MLVVIRTVLELGNICRRANKRFDTRLEERLGERRNRERIGDLRVRRREDTLRRLIRIWSYIVSCFV